MKGTGPPTPHHGPPDPRMALAVRVGRQPNLPPCVELVFTAPGEPDRTMGMEATPAAMIAFTILGHCETLEPGIAERLMLHAAIGGRTPPADPRKRKPPK